MTELAGSKDNLEQWVNGKLTKEGLVVGTDDAEIAVIDAVTQTIDASIVDFIDKYITETNAYDESIKLTIDPIADIYFLKGTSLKYSEWAEAKIIANFLTEDLWDNALEFTYGHRPTSEVAQLQKLSFELFGDEEVWDELIFRGQMPDWFFADLIKFTDNNDDADQLIGVDDIISIIKGELDAGKVRESGAELLIDIFATYKEEKTGLLAYADILPFLQDVYEEQYWSTRIPNSYPVEYILYYASESDPFNLDNFDLSPWVTAADPRTVVIF